MVTLVTPGSFRGARTGRKMGVWACRCWQARGTSCTMAPVLKGLASWHDEAPKKASVSWRNLMLNRSVGWRRTGNPFGKLGKSFPVSEGRSS